MALGNRENAKTPALQVNGQAIACDNRYSHDEIPMSLGKVGEAWAMETPIPSGYPVSDAIEKVMDINRRLLSKIEILHMKVEVDSRQRDIILKELQETERQKLEVKETEVKHLKSYLEQKEANTTMLSKDNKKKNAEISRLQKYVSELRKDVEASKKFADDIQRQLDSISGDSDAKRKQAGTEKDTEIGQLRTEVNKMKEQLATLENELTKAKDTIVEQQGMMRLMENDSINIHRRFQDDLQKVQLIVRKEIESLREVIGRQRQEMRDIRAQNVEIQNVVAEIRRMVLPAQNLQTSPVERAPNMASAVPVLPALQNDRQTGSPGNQGGRRR